MTKKNKKVDPGIEFDNSVDKEIFKLRNKQSKCMHAGCNAFAISSHSISRAISLGEIAKDGILLTPKSERKYPDKKYFIGDIGYKDASTFMGFCEDHDKKLFHELDRHSIQTYMDIVTQLYRSISYNYSIDSVYLIAQIRVLERLMETHENVVMNAMHKNHSMLSRLENLQTRLSDLMQKDKVKQEVQDPFSVNRIQASNIGIYYKKLNFQVPIAINTKYMYRLSNEEFELFVINIPYKDCTDFLVMFDLEYSKYFHSFLEYIFSSDINILNYIERVIVSSENWWLKPEILEHHSDLKKRIIQEDLYFLIGNEKYYDISIFDELRLSLISDDPKFDQEREKLTLLPEREPFEKRKKEIQQKMAATTLRLFED
ncbi:hypothetical protein AV545_22670 [Paenibacillus jamilae]|uniref:hypothetical protein n=1 Tax=Paenibacillus jamilae TaxID=114136 RepID=UPI0007ABFC7F|nr:hypothetical protein [Paenibacillus jamilae]KZE67903.1 hypothetical protein AV545_22670 [Paenibacillus jamilae]